jgi:hypothetical protein
VRDGGVLVVNMRDRERTLREKCKKACSVTLRY